MALKIRTVTINGEDRVAPETMELLKRVADHRDFCGQCEQAMKSGTGNYCKVGAEIILELNERPDVEFVPEEEAGEPPGRIGGPEAGDPAAWEPEGGEK